MRAIVYRRYGGPEVLACEEVEKPAPGDDAVLVQVRAAAVNPLDWHFMRGEPYFLRLGVGLTAPRHTRIGVDMAGVVEVAGRNVTAFKPGDEVFGLCEKRGSLAEYALSTQLAPKPRAVSFEEAAAAPVAAMTALQALRDKGKVVRGQNVLVNGAAGGVGTFAVQIAKALGAEVTGVCSTRNLDLVRSIGADHVIDYTREDFTAGERRYDVLLDCIWNHPLAHVRRVLEPRGRYLVVGGQTGRWIKPVPETLGMVALSAFVSQSLVPVLALPNRDDVATIGRMMEEGRVKAVIDRRYRLEEAAEAIRYLEAGHARGKVVVSP